MLKLGFTIYSNPIEQFPSIARHAETLGFHRVCIGEHIVAPVASNISDSEELHKGRARPPVLPSDDRFYDLWTMVGAIVASTSRLKVTTGIALLPLRHPLITARACITAQRLSQGRFSLGIGTGWLKAEFEALGVPFERRGALTDEAIEVLTQTLAGGAVSHNGPAYPFEELELTDEPVEVPLIVGGISSPAFARAARHGDGWYGPKIPLDQFKNIRADIESMRKEAGRSDRTFTYSAMLPTPEVDVLNRWEDAGLSEGVLAFDDIHPEDPRTTDLDTKLRCLEAVASRLRLTPSS